MQFKHLNLVQFFVLALLLSSCDNEDVSLGSDSLHVLNQSLTNAIVLDGFSPPVASRIYAYSHLAYYETLCRFDSTATSYMTRLHGFEVDEVDPVDGLNSEVSAAIAFCEVAKELVYRDHIMDSVLTELLSFYPLTESVIERHKTSVDLIIQPILGRMKNDNYELSRTLPYFESNLNATSGKWLPTPPTYSEAIEPHWDTILPFFLKNSDQFRPLDPIEFSIEEESDFYRSATLVMDAVNELDSTGENIARFWDCNPMVAVTAGHIMHVKRQLTPGGHWIGITGSVAAKENLDLLKTSEIYTRVAIVLADAFISCWEAKYRTNLIRPETYINEYIDGDWRPVLETPMFPEHTSGHSVVSAAAAEVLTAYFGDDYFYLDSINVPFGLPIRSFNSFRDAAEEAAISRLYGGIHYMPAIDYGKQQGRQVAEYFFQEIDQEQP